jgi:hypothetical protein
MISSFGNIAVSGTRFRAIGGTAVQDLNGYRHHVFNSSGTLTISGNPKQVYILAQDGGSSSPARLSNRAAAGGGSGETRYLQATLASGSLSVVVGGANSSSYINGISSTMLNTNISIAGGAGGVWNGDSGNAGTVGQNGFLHSEKNSIYNSLTRIPERSGGSGGGGGYVTVRASGGQFGGGDGGHQTSRDGGNALANSGAGGGGASSARSTLTCYDPYFQYFYFCGWNEGTRGVDGLGGSGYLVISYALS